MKLKHCADVFVVKKRKMYKPTSSKSIKYKQFMCKVKEKMSKQKGLYTLIIDYNGFFLQNK